MFSLDWGRCHAASHHQRQQWKAWSRGDVGLLVARNQFSDGFIHVELGALDAGDPETNPWTLPPPRAIYPRLTLIKRQNLADDISLGLGLD